MATTYTDIGRDYLNAHKHDRMYSMGGWYRYERGVWTRVEREQFQLEVWNLLEFYEKSKKVKPSITMRNNVEEFMRAKLFIPHTELNTWEHMINMRNGVYDLKDGILLSHDPIKYFTSQLPFDYVPGADCPLWQQYLEKQITNRDLKYDPELAEYIQEAVGYSMTMRNDQDVSFFCYGDGGTGKSTLLNIIKKLAGDSGMVLNVNRLKQNEYQLALLPGKRVVYCSEADSQEVVADEIVKNIISGDPIQVRMIYREPIQIEPKVKVWWMLNTLPPVTDPTDGFWRRIRVIKFWRKVPVDERIDHIWNVMENEGELPGIFNWAMVGLSRFTMRNGFDTPKSVLVETSSYRIDSSPIAQFLDEQMAIGLGVGDVISSRIYNEYKTWAYANGFKQVSIKTFRHTMENLGHYPVRRSSGVYYVNMMVKI